MEFVGAVAAKHAPIASGLVIGSVAKFGRMVAIGEPFTWKQVIGHCMMMGMAGVIATITTDAAGIVDPNGRTFAAAVIAIAASDVIQYLATRGWQRFLQSSRGDLDGLADAMVRARGEFRQNEQIGASARHLADDLKRKDEA